MYWLTEDALLVCPHESGYVQIVATQNLVTINGRRVLVDNDPEQRQIVGCPWTAPGMKPCLTTLKVVHGYSDLIRIQGRRLCLDPVTGLTDGTPPGAFDYAVRRPGQALVSER